MRPAYTPTKQVSKKANRVAAFAKIMTAPIATLTPMMVESIAASHERKGTVGFQKLLRELRATLEHRIAREARQ